MAKKRWSQTIDLSDLELEPLMDEKFGELYYLEEGETPTLLIDATNAVLSELLDRVKAGQKRVRITVTEIKEE